MHTIKPSKFLVANHLLGPSYISGDSALAHYGLIPESVFETVSMTSKASRNFNTVMGVFSYTHLALPFGISQTALPENQFALIASPEKALLDKIITTSGALFRSIAAAKTYLLENLRMDKEALKNLDTQQMKEWLNNAPKQESLSLIIQSISQL